MNFNLADIPSEPARSPAANNVLGRCRTRSKGKAVAAGKSYLQSTLDRIKTRHDGRESGGEDNAYYTESAVAYAGASAEQKAEIQGLQNSVNVLWAVVDATASAALNEVLNAGVYTFPTTGAVIRRVDGSSDQETRDINEYPCWKGAIDEAQANMFSFYQSSNYPEQQTETAWQGGPGFTEPFTETSLSHVMSGFDDSITASISAKYIDPQSTQLTAVQESGTSSYLNTLNFNVIFLDEIGSAGCTMVVSEFKMSSKVCQDLDCKNPTASGTAQSSYRAVMYTVNAPVLVAQTDSEELIDAGQGWLQDVLGTNQGAVESDPDAEPETSFDLSK